jgi:TATA-box binding protein (TBP) (component of TFIID and TFIIIB)
MILEVRPLCFRENFKRNMELTRLVTVGQVSPRRYNPNVFAGIFFNSKMEPIVVSIVASAWRLLVNKSSETHLFNWVSSALFYLATVLQVYLLSVAYRSR